MQQPFSKKDSSPNFSNPTIRQEFVQDTQNRKSLLQKELDVNHSEQNLLGKRIQMMKEFVNDLPASDPHYSMMLAQVQMDQVELDELKVRETLLIQQLSD